MYCPAFDHGVTIFPDGKIRPCCQISAEYSKPLSEINNPNRFVDLKNQKNPSACNVCYQKESHGLGSYRKFFLSKVQPTAGIQFVDFRHSNQCNLKCRYCNPHFSNQWAKELDYPVTLMQAEIEPYYDALLTNNVNDLYWCGGEPLIIKEHYDVLERLVAQGLSKNIDLRYNTNFTAIQYKDKNLFDLWKNFKSIILSISLDATGQELSYIRSGSDWNIISKNIDTLLLHKDSIENLNVSFATTLSILNVWFLPSLYEYAQSRNIPVSLSLLSGPDYLSLSAIYTDELKNQAKEILSQVKSHIPDAQYNTIINTMNANDNEYLFNHAVRHILLLDNVRNEKLFDLLPFKKLALELTAKNDEYE